VKAQQVILTSRTAAAAAAAAALATDCSAPLSAASVEREATTMDSD